MPGNTYASIQNPRQYRALRRRGYSKEAAARISNARTPGHRVKAPNYGARAGQTIAGNLVRGSDGKFSSGGGGTSTPRQSRAAERRTQRQQRADERARARDEALAQEDTQRATEDAYVAGGTTPKQRAARRREVAQARRERAAARREAARQQREAERQTRTQEDEGERTAREQEAAEREAAKKPKGGGGGGGGKPKPSEDEKKREQQAKRAATAVSTAQQIGQDSTFVDGLRAAAEGRLTGPAPRLEALGFAADGEATDQGRRALAALERGDTRGYLAAVQDARSAQARARAAQERRTATEARRAAAEQRRAIAAQERAARQAEAERKRQARGKSFTVYKDARGRDRWLAISSTAYRDRDGEIVSREALRKAVAQGDATKERGPLRYWHVPGVDIGDCDYQAVAHDGRLLVESGTFRSPVYAEALKARGRGYQVSIGFVHPRSQPGPDGVFTDIAIFERSITPPGRASNPFTSITTKEGRMLPPEKDEQLAALLGGRETEAYKAAVSNIAQTDKAAQDQGVAYKSDDAPTVYDLNGEPAIIQDGKVVVLKALDVAEKAPPPMEMAEEIVEEAVVEEMAEAPEAAEPFLTDGELDMLAERVALKLAPLFEIEKKMSGYVGELKTMLGGMQTAKDDTLAKLTADTQALAADVAALKGDAPRASQEAIGLPVPDALAQTVKAQAAPGEQWGFDSFLAGFNVNGAAR